MKPSRVQTAIAIHEAKQDPHPGVTLGATAAVAAHLATVGTGFANDSTGHVEATSASFDMTTLAGQYVGLSLNGGASASWTTTQAQAEAIW